MTLPSLPPSYRIVIIVKLFFIHTVVGKVVAEIPFTPGHEMVGKVS